MHRRRGTIVAMMTTTTTTMMAMIRLLLLLLVATSTAKATTPVVSSSIEFWSSIATSTRVMERHNTRRYGTNTTTVVTASLPSAYTANPTIPFKNTTARTMSDCRIVATTETTSPLWRKASATPSRRWIPTWYCTMPVWMFTGTTSWGGWIFPRRVGSGDAIAGFWIGAFRWGFRLRPWWGEATTRTASMPWVGGTQSFTKNALMFGGNTRCGCDKDDHCDDDCDCDCDDTVRGQNNAMQYERHARTGVCAAREFEPNYSTGLVVWILLCCRKKACGSFVVA
mmetsp:Transcript_25419/g.52919  ORF Transcript_25419/g.52919 Transcript_25419/m.52919 type:complete len:282 (+) Transcript_25419:373-1218(+)